jgi:hypothetical protein
MESPGCMLAVTPCRDVSLDGVTRCAAYRALGRYLEAWCARLSDGRRAHWTCRMMTSAGLKQRAPRLCQSHMIKATSTLKGLASGTPIRYHPQSGWFDEAPQRGPATRGKGLKAL